MRKPLLLGVLLLSTTASAATWEYASFVIWNAKSGEKVFFWNTPDETGRAKRAQGSKLEAVSTGSDCNVKPQGQHVMNELDLFQCFGTRGWELVTTDSESLSAVTVKSYWFKRSK